MKTIQHGIGHLTICTLCIWVENVAVFYFRLTVFSYDYLFCFFIVLLGTIAGHIKILAFLPLFYKDIVDLKGITKCHRAYSYNMVGRLAVWRYFDPSQFKGLITEYVELCEGLIIGSPSFHDSVAQFCSCRIVFRVQDFRELFFRIAVGVIDR